ncbi:GTP-binding protein [Alkalihalobacillus sp. MEB130]|uniref:GTP-binding protein n=1 Tax=Alkalihalobacillus sp. MEB130 TaxID=2976704 RepID=UPI0028DE6D4B|nr:GTP-binding protein [Alkalihalobacillus sp. MEB130]MDT8862191.1 GTP-binding protein [Alkalihalobacillus sp. MEB130]
MAKQKTLTVITGFSLKDKCDVIRKMQEKNPNNRKVILFRPTDVQLALRSEEDPFSLTHFISEAVHHLEINTITNLIYTLEDEFHTNHTDEIILDIYPISHVDTLFASLASLSARLTSLVMSHIHIINARDFWFTYFSEHAIEVNEFDSEISIEYTFGETLIHQLEHAEAIYLTNTDELSHERVGEISVFIQNLQPNAVVERLKEVEYQNEHKGTFYNIEEEAKQLYNDQIKLFSSRRSLQVIGQYGIDTFVYKSVFPVDFRLLEQFFTKIPSDVFRMKGRCYNLSTQELHCISQVGSSIQVDTNEFYFTNQKDVLTEFLFIGSEVNQEEIEKMLNDCLQITYENKIAY